MKPYNRSIIVVKLTIIMKLKEAKLLINEDYLRYVSDKQKANSFIYKLRIYYLERGFRFSFWLRLSNVNGFIGFISRIILHHLQSKFGILIHSSTKIGGGLYLGHGNGIIINPTAILGKNVSLSQFLSIGSNKGKAAVIEDNVYIAPHVSIIENVKIGENSTIGAGAVVNKDIPANSIAVGIPAKVIKTK